LSALTMSILTAPWTSRCRSYTSHLPRAVRVSSDPWIDCLAGILMRNTLILIGQIKKNKEEGLDDFNAVVEATVQRSRPVVLTALAAVLAFIPLTFFGLLGSLAYTLIGGTAVGTVLYARFSPRALHDLVPRQAQRCENRSRRRSLPS